MVAARLLAISALLLTCACGDDTAVSSDDAASTAEASSASSTGPTGTASNSSGTGEGGGSTASSSASAGGGGGGGGGGDVTSSSSAGGSGGSGGEGPVGQPECVVDEECKLVNDCCTCASIPVIDRPEECQKQCLIPVCEGLGLSADTEPVCLAGRCVAGYVCDWSLTSCGEAPPDCAAGTTASIEGDCFGPCVAADECASVAGCEQCDGDLACVQRAAFGVTSHCVSQPPECATPSCHCMGPSVCTEAEACTEDGDTVVCSCIDC